MTYAKSLFTAALIASSTLASAAADFTTIRRTSYDLSDAVPSVVFNFTLPNTVNTSSSTSNSAVLDLEVYGSEYNYNEIYVNPPTTVCTSNATDANQAGSLGFLLEHDGADLKNEWATNHRAFSSSLLQSGTNELLICIRNVNGDAGPSVGNLDNITVRSVVLHYHTSP